MKRRPSFSFLVCIAVALVFGGIGFWFLSKLKAFPMHQWRSLSFSEIVRGRPGYTAEEKAAARKRIAELKRRILVEFPALVTHEKPVPDERNGFLQLYDLAKEMESGEVLITPDLQSALESSTPWDSAAMRSALAENTGLIGKIETIAALPDRSSANMPESYTGYFSGLQVKVCADIMLARARLAAEAKDETEALRLVTATLNIASHQDQVETPTFMTSTISVLIDRQVDDAIMKHLLPSLGKDADLSRWSDALAARPTTSPDTFGRVLRGEWNITLNLVMTPLILESDLKNSPKGTDDGFRAIASQYDFLVRHLTMRKTEAFLSIPTPPPPASKIPANFGQMLDLINSGREDWGKGYARSVSARALTLAALELLILEKTGATLAANSTAGVTFEPLSEERFLFDLATRTNSAPPAIAEEAGVKPVALPW